MIYCYINDNHVYTGLSNVMIGKHSSNELIFLNIGELDDKTIMMDKVYDAIL